MMTLYYITWSEGFRPGLLNRPAGRTNSDGSYTVPATIDSDEITNYEFGWKSVLRDGQLRFNGSVFMVDVTDFKASPLTRALLIYSLIMQQMQK